MEFLFSWGSRSGAGDKITKIKQAAEVDASVVTTEESEVQGPVLEAEEKPQIVKPSHRAFEFVEKASVDMHFLALPALSKRFEALGYTKLDLRKALAHIEKEAPLLIHVNFDRNIDHFLLDSNYRNVFEINTSQSYGMENPRVDKESKLFGQIYDAAQPHERIKYGCLNIFVDPNGVKRAAQSYGYDHLILSNSLRQGQVTVTHGNSQSNSFEMLGTLRFFGHLLSRFSDGEIVDLVKLCSGKDKPDAAQEGSNADHSNYRECQFHADIRFASDVDQITLTIPHSQPVLTKIIEFAAKHHIDLRVNNEAQQVAVAGIVRDLALEHRVSTLSAGAKDGVPAAQVWKWLHQGLS